MTKITFVGDLHSGNIVSNRQAFRAALRKAEKVILMGDIIEAITKKDKRHSKNDQKDSYSTQIANTIKDIKPYEDKIMQYIIGNHEDTLLSISDIDSVDLICTALDIESSYTKLFDIDDVKMLVTHGSGSTTTYGGCVNALCNLAKDHTADYYFRGHTHKLFDMEIQHNPKSYTIVNTGTLLGQPEYAKKRAYPQPIEGYYILDTKLRKLEKVIVR